MLGNKIDLINEIQVEQQQATNMAEKHNIPYFQTSAKDATNLDIAFKQLLTSILNNEDLQDKIDFNRNIRLEDVRRNQIKRGSKAGCCQ